MVSLLCAQGRFDLLSAEWVRTVPGTPQVLLQVSHLQELSKHLPMSKEQLQRPQRVHPQGRSARNSPCIRHIPIPEGRARAAGQAGLQRSQESSPGCCWHRVPPPGLRASRWQPPRPPCSCGARISQTRSGRAAGWLPG